MSFDADLREELIRRYGKKNLTVRKWKYYQKVILWDVTIWFSHLLKRLLDIIVSLIALIALSPIFLITSIAIFIEDPGPIFYVQTRGGKNGREIKFPKFRSMITNADQIKEELMKQNESEDGVLFKMKDDPRITKVGQIIRRFSIDELPQILMVLKGDMSLVGPRPPLPDEVAEYTLEDRKRLHVTPGITGIWQVSGRSDIPFKQQVELDKLYIRNQSFWKDIIILLKTIPAVLTGKGAY